ncbi:hypothetical protein V6N13_149690 [Hibiscus sabdariffa]
MVKKKGKQIFLKRRPGKSHVGTGNTPSLIPDEASGSENIAGDSLSPTNSHSPIPLTSLSAYWLSLLHPVLGFFLRFPFVRFCISSPGSGGLRFSDSFLDQIIEV